MAEWKNYNGNGNLQFNVEWQASSTNSTVSLAPYIQRWDRYDTWNSGGEFWEHLTLPDGSSGLWGGYGYYRIDSGRGNDYTRTIDTFATRTYTRGHSAYNVYLTIDCYQTGTAYDGYFHNLGDGNLTWVYTVPARPSYTVSFNANGGSDAPSNQTKWYGEALALSSGEPIRSGYSFVKWNTSSDGTGTDYAAGGTYNANSAVTLYAIWKKNTWVVTYKPNGGVGDEFTATKTYGQSLTLASSGFTRQYYSLDRWNTSADGGGTSYALGSSYTTDANLTLYATWKLIQPNAPTSLEATRNSDTSATIAWTRPSDADSTWNKIVIYRSVNGGEYNSLVELTPSQTSYTDTTTTANNSYRYRLNAYNNGGGGQYSPDAFTSTIYNTPAAPTAVTAVPTAGSADVTLILSNAANTATGFDVEYSADGESWSTSGLTIDSYTGMPPTEISVGMTNGGNFYFRVKNTRGDLKSAAAISNQIANIAPPQPPTLNSPTSGGYVAYGGSSTSVTFSWTHNPTDNTAQTAAQVGVSINGGSETVYSVTTAQSLTRSLSLPINASVTWRVRTKGADANYGGWSGNSTFAIYKAPTLTITSLPSTIVGVPVNYELSYSDDSGVFSSGTLTITQGGATVYSERLNAPQSGTIEGAVFASEFLPEDGNTYTFTFSASSNTTLSATVQTNVQVNMEAPYIGTLNIINDPETGYVSLTYGWNSSAGGQPVDEVFLYRITAQGRILLATATSNNSSCLDMYAPLNTDYRYLVVTHGTNQAISQIEFQNRLNTGWWFVYWNGKIARAKWNPNGSKSVSRPERTRVHYIGRPDPVSYDGTAVREESSMEWRIVEREYAMKFLEMVREIGRGIYKSGSGEVYHADFDSATVESDFHRNQPYGTLTLPIVRIDGEML